MRWQWLATGLRSAWPFYVTDMGAVGSLYFDRFLVSAWLGLEATGVYTFFWSAANVVHTLAAYGIVQPDAPKLVAAANRRRADEFARVQRQLLIASWSWAGVLSIGLCIALYLLLPLLHRPLLEESLPIFWLIMFATVLRIVAEGYHFVLYALGKDRAMAAASLLGVGASAALNALLVPLLGLLGAGLAYTLAAAGLLVIRRAWAQNQKFGARHA
jgi:O-antigen/teichoic acid export membrane protein